MVSAHVLRAEQVTLVSRKYGVHATKHGDGSDAQPAERAQGHGGLVLDDLLDDLLDFLDDLLEDLLLDDPRDDEEDDLRFDEEVFFPTDKSFLPAIDAGDLGGR